MLSVPLSILVTLAAQAHAKELSMNRQGELHDLVDNLVDNLVDRLLNQVFRLSFSHHADLDNISFGKLGHLVTLPKIRGFLVLRQRGLVQNSPFRLHPLVPLSTPKLIRGTGLAKASADESLGLSTDALFVSLARAAGQCTSDLKANDIANRAQELMVATAAQSDAQLFTALAKQAERRVGDVKKQNLANTAWAFATAGAWPLRPAPVWTVCASRKTGQPNCAEWIAHALADAGCTHVYGGHGGALQPMVNAVVENPRLTWICTRNEGGASLMAGAHAKLTGALSVCIATAGPGATNLATGIYDAAMDQAPMIVITGLKPRAARAYTEFQDFGQAQMFAAGGLAFSHDISAPEAVAPLLRDAVSTAMTQKTVVHLAIPVDVQAAKSPYALNRPLIHQDARDAIAFPAADDTIIDSVAKVLKSAGQNGAGRVFIGVGGRCVNDGPAILKLAERIRAPILTRLSAKGSCNESHPLVFGVVGVHGKYGMEMAAQIIETSELMIGFGLHDYTVSLCNRAGLQVRPLIQFEPDPTCLMVHARFRSLYTVVGDASRNIETLLKKLGPKPEQTGVDYFWTKAVASAGYKALEHQKKVEAAMGEARDLWKQIHNDKWTEITREDTYRRFERFASSKPSYKHCHPSSILREMSTHMAKEDVLCVDFGDITLWASLCGVLTKGSRTLASERMGTPGYGLTAGIASCLVQQDKGRAVVVAGDGGVQMTLHELGTLLQIFANAKSIPYKLLIIIFDNGNDSPDFVTVAKAYGGDGVTLHEEKELKSAMETAFSSTGLFIIHALQDPSIKADMASFNLDDSLKMISNSE